jgi:glyoxylase-like metal-dependent hydrolase (beta-lactamase superfamily II)
LQSLSLDEPEFVGVQTDEHGIVSKPLEYKRAALLYLQPNFQNPTGALCPSSSGTRVTKQISLPDAKAAPAPATQRTFSLVRASCMYSITFQECFMFPQVQSFHDAVTGTVSHVVHSGAGSTCAVIDPVLDYDAASGRSSTASLDRILAFIAEQQLVVGWILETHVHADHLSGAVELKRRTGGSIAMSERIADVRSLFSTTFDLADGHGFDQLFGPDEEFAIGTMKARAIPTPGHTLADMAYLVGDALFVGDTLFMPDLGTARCDFPGGDAQMLYASIRRLLTLPESTRVFVCHDYPPAGRDVRFSTTIAEQRQHNIHVRDDISESEFVAIRTTRDLTLKVPALLFPAMQVNLRGGRLPASDHNGRRYMRIPIDEADLVEDPSCSAR